MTIDFCKPKKKPVSINRHMKLINASAQWNQSSSEADWNLIMIKELNNPAESWFSALSVFRDAFNLGSVKSMIPTQSYKVEESFSTFLYVH